MIVGYGSSAYIIYILCMVFHNFVFAQLVASLQMFDSVEFYVFLQPMHFLPT